MNRSCVGLVQRQLALCFIFSLTRCRNLRYRNAVWRTKIYFICFYYVLCVVFNIVVTSLSWYFCQASMSWVQEALQETPPTKRAHGICSSSTLSLTQILAAQAVCDSVLFGPWCFPSCCVHGNMQKELREEKAEREMSSVSCCWPGHNMIRSW